MACENVVGKGNEYLTTFPVSGRRAMGECLAHCTRYNTDINNAAQRCTYGRVQDEDCHLYNNEVFVNNRDDGVLGDESPYAQFIMRRNATASEVACLPVDLWTTTSTTSK